MQQQIFQVFRFGAIDFLGACILCCIHSKWILEQYKCACICNSFHGFPVCDLAGLSEGECSVAKVFFRQSLFIVVAIFFAISIFTIWHLQLDLWILNLLWLVKVI
jgi:hypothetical protein